MDEVQELYLYRNPIGGTALPTILLRVMLPQTLYRCRVQCYAVCGTNLGYGATRGRKTAPARRFPTQDCQ
eukprot:1370899-Rhodomonas_salina.1